MGYAWPLPLAYPGYDEGMEAYRKAWAAYATQRFEEAEGWASKAIRSDPENAHAHALKGDLAYLRHDLSQAKQAWEKALRLNPALRVIRNQIAQAENELRLEARLTSASLGTLTIRVPSDLPPESVREILATLQAAMARLEKDFQYRPRRPLTVLIYPAESWGQILDLSPVAHLPTQILGLFDGKIRLPAPVTPAPAEEEIAGQKGGQAHFPAPSQPTRENEPVPSRLTSFSSVLWHEYAHAVVYDLSHGRAPRWLQEGLAQEAESKGVRPLWHSVDNFPTRGRGGLVPSESLPLKALFGISERPGEPVILPANRFYASSHSLVRYLLETKGWDRMRAFLKALGKGTPVEAAIQDLYGWDLETLERRWNAWVKS